MSEPRRRERLLYFVAHHRAALAYAVVVVALLIGMARIELIALDNRRLIEEQEALIAAQEEVRIENLRGLEILQVQNCLDIEKLKRAERQRAIQSFRRLDETLHLLGIEKTPAIVRAAKRSRDEALERYAATKGGCGPFPAPIRPSDLPRGAKR